MRQGALRLLARREHARRELAGKLCQRGYDGALVEQVLDELEQKRLLSDTRFSEAYVRQRRQRGYGPARIQAELRERGVDAGLAAEALTHCAAEWREQIEAVRRKRFGAALPQDIKERARQARFLQYRGFPSEQVMAVLQGEEPVEQD